MAEDDRIAQAAADIVELLSPEIYEFGGSEEPAVHVARVAAILRDRFGDTAVSLAEPPDFDQIARRLVDVSHVDDWPAYTQEAQRAAAVTDVATALRQVWNARGAADITKLDIIIGSLYGLSLNEKAMSSALRSLDR